MEDEHPDLGAGLMCRQRLAMHPHTKHRIGRARVVLRDDQDLHELAAESPFRRRISSRSCTGRQSLQSRS